MQGREIPVSFEDKPPLGRLNVFNPQPVKHAAASASVRVHLSLLGF
jgi:hypothetical protein